MIKNIRYPVVDCIRGLAILAMMIYHFGFDLNMLGYLSQNINHSMTWQIARGLILGTFLFIAGFSMALAAPQTLKQRLVRLVPIAGCALLVSVVSYFMFPDSWIFFGVLHFVVVASFICGLMMQHKILMLTTAIALLGIGFFYQSPVFDQPLLQWLGMMTHKPITEDYVPMLPWISVMMIGIIIGEWALTRTQLAPLACRPTAALKPVQWLGRHSLAVYMIHQPILLVVLTIFGVLYR